MTLVKNTKILEGLPSQVDAEMQDLIKDGWQLNGQLWHRTVDGNNIAVQGMYLPDGNDAIGGRKVQVFEVVTNFKADFEMIAGHLKNSKPKPDRGVFTYTLKVIAPDEESAKRNISIGLAAQRTAGVDNVSVSYISEEDLV